MLDVTHIIQTGGLVLLGFFLFAEVGLFLGFFLPGDTLLIAAGIYAKQGKFSIAAVMVVAAIAATAGDSTSYWIGRKMGRKVFRKEDSVIFKPEHIARTEKFYEKYGAKALLVTHFIAVVRTFTPLLAGVGKMPYRKFLTFDAIGDTAWAIVVSLVGYIIGAHVSPSVADHYILLAVGAVIIISLAPTLYQVTRLLLAKRQARRPDK
jgi:membrane-associated protein